MQEYNLIDCTSSLLPENLVSDLNETIQQHGFKRLLLAVSGGLDSICLAHFFIVHKEALGIEWIGIAHVHHGLREGTANRDAEFVKNFAFKNKCNFFLERLDGTALKNAGGSLEDKARDARYKALHSVAMANHAEAIVTAHHAGDQAETVYLRLRRGVGLAGLRGIQTVRSLGALKLFRPFLNVTREELGAYASEFNLDWCEDESNSDTKFARNLIRHERLPHLESLNPGACQQLCRVTNLAQEAYSRILNKANSVFDQAIVPQEKCPADTEIQKYSKTLALDLRKISTDLLHTELFRLWLETKGFRLAVNQNRPCLPNPIPRHFRHKQVILEKRRNILWFCDFSTIRDSDNLYFIDDK